MTAVQQKITEYAAWLREDNPCQRTKGTSCETVDADRREPPCDNCRYVEHMAGAYAEALR